MNPQSKSQRAKRLYAQLRADGELPDIFFSGLLKDTIWVTRNSRAYYVHEIATDHLANIIAHCKVVNMEVPDVIVAEYRKRIEVPVPPIDRAYLEHRHSQDVTTFKPRWYQGKIWDYMNKHFPKTMIRLRWRGRNHL